MPKFNVYGNATIGVHMTVEADSAEEAIEKAHEEFPGLSGYCGNGGTDKLVGVHDENVSLDADGDFEFVEADPQQE